MTTTQTILHNSRAPRSGESRTVPRTMAQRSRWCVLGALCATLLGCQSSPPEPKPRTEAQEVKQESSDQGSEKAAPGSSPQSSGTQSSGKPETKTGKTTVSPDDPIGGEFTLEQATEGLEKEGKLTAAIDTSLGELSCELYEDKAPITVANFVGLARGLRPFQHKGEWVKRPAYDGTTFHRIIKGFMIQGGDPDGTGRGQPGYVIPDEIWEGAKHDQRGLLCMANRGPDTNGMQFFITDAAAAHLDRSYTIFGKCTPDATIEKLASVETHGRNAKAGQRPDQPVQAPEIRSIKIARR